MSCQEKYLRLCKVKLDELDKPCTEISLCYLARAVSDWEQLAPFLKITRQEIVAIKRRYPDSYHQQKVQLLLKWQEKVGKCNATYRKIFTVLDEHCTGQPTWEELDKPLDNLELAYIANVIENWEMLAPHLMNLTPAEKVEIRRDSPNYWHQKYNMLMRWKDRVGERATTRRNVITALWAAKEERTTENLLYPQTPALNPVVDLFRVRLKQCYRCQPPPSATQWPGVDSIYIPPTLTLEPSSPVKRQQERDTRLPVAIKLRDILTKNTQTPLALPVQKRVLLKGSAGSGKSTIVWRISQEWAMEKSFTDLDLLITVSLDSPRVRSATSLVDLLPHPDEQVRRAVESYLYKKGGEGVGFLFDGLDLVPAEEHLRSNFITRLLKGDAQVSLPKAKILITSRPEGVRSDFTWSTTILLEGFAQEQTEAYFTEMAKTSGDRFDIDVDSNPAIYSLCSLPLNAAIFTFLLQVNQPAQPQPSTRTELYNLFILSTLLRNIQERIGSKNGSTLEELPDYDSIPEVVRETFWQLCHLAWQGILQSKSVFTKADIRQAGIDLKNLHVLGLTQESRYLTQTGISSQYTFHHLSIQEFLAALYLSSECSDDKQVADFVQSVTVNHTGHVTKEKSEATSADVSDPNPWSQVPTLYLVPVENVAGHVAKEKSEAASADPNPWSQVPTLFLLPFFVGLSRRKEKITETAVDFLLATYAKTRSVFDRKDKSTSHFAPDDVYVQVQFPLVQCLYCVYESQSPKLCHTITRELSAEKDLENGKPIARLPIPWFVDRSIAVCLGYYLAHCSSPEPLLVDLSISSTAFGDLGLSLMIQQFQNTRSTLDSDSKKMLAQSSKDLTMSLSLEGNSGISHAGVNTICSSLTLFHPLLTSSLSFNNAWIPTTDKDAALTTLVKAFAEYGHLKELGLSRCGLTADDSPRLERLLECTQLEKLHLGENRLGDLVTRLASRFGRHPNLKSLSLTFCKLTPAAVRALAEHLANNSKLESLYIAGNRDISEKDLKAFLTAMKKNKALKRLYCSDSDLSMGAKWIIWDINKTRKENNLPELKVEPDTYTGYALNRYE